MPKRIDGCYRAQGPLVPAEANSPGEPGHEHTAHQAIRHPAVASAREARRHRLTRPAARPKGHVGPVDPRGGRRAAARQHIQQIISEAMVPAPRTRRGVRQTPRGQRQGPSLAVGDSEKPRRASRTATRSQSRRPRPGCRGILAEGKNRVTFRAPMHQAEPKQGEAQTTRGRPAILR
jgi:hypothetical protein